MKMEADWNITTGIIYRNPQPHVTSRHAYFPSVVISENGEMLVSFAIGEAFEAVNLDTYLSRSADGGVTWSPPELLLESSPSHVSQFARLTYLGNGKTIAIVNRCLRDEHLSEGLANPVTIGFVPTKLLLVNSHDFGKKWSPPAEIIPPLTGPCFEMCSSIVKLSGGTWIWPTSTWRDWNGYEPEGMKMVAFVSYDEGNTWTDYWRVMDRHDAKIIYWESKILELNRHLLVAVAWTYDERNGKDLPIHFSYSIDDGATWTTPVSTGLTGQTVFISRVDAEHILTVYRRTDEPGLWAAVSAFAGGNWIVLYQLPLWGVKDRSLVKSSGNMVQDFNELKFGAPSVVKCGDNEFFIAFWCYEKLVSNIRWIKLSAR